MKQHITGTPTASGLSYTVTIYIPVPRYRTGMYIGNEKNIHSKLPVRIQFRQGTGTGSYLTESSFQTHAFYDLIQDLRLHERTLLIYFLFKGSLSLGFFFVKRQEEENGSMWIRVLINDKIISRSTNLVCPMLSGFWPHLIPVTSTHSPGRERHRCCSPVETFHYPNRKLYLTSFLGAVPVRYLRYLLKYDIPVPV